MPKEVLVTQEYPADITLSPAGSRIRLVTLEQAASPSAT